MNRPPRAPLFYCGTKRGVCDIYKFLTSREVNMAEYWTLRFDIRQDLCYCCCCEKGTRRKSSNLDLTISCLNLKINSMSYGVISFASFPFYVRFIHSARNQNSSSAFQRFYFFRPRHRGRKGTKTARVE